MLPPHFGQLRSVAGDVVPASRAIVWHTPRLHRQSANCCAVLKIDHGSDDASKEKDYNDNAQKRVETKTPENQIQGMEQHIRSHEQARSKKGAASSASTRMWISQVHYDHCVSRLSPYPLPLPLSFFGLFLWRLDCLVLLLLCVCLGRLGLLWYGCL